MDIASLGQQATPADRTLPIGDWRPAATPIRVRVTLRGLPAPAKPISLLAVINTAAAGQSRRL